MKKFFDSLKDKFAVKEDAEEGEHQEGEDGYVELEISHHPFPNGGRIIIKVNDSGQGFDIKNYYKNRIEKSEGNTQLSGRGIDLVEQLCDSLDFQENGSVVEASYVWTS